MTSVPARSPATVHSWRAAELGGVDFLHGRFTTHAFARHTHDTYSIGLLSAGAMTFACRGEARYTLRPGQIGLILPDEVHTGQGETRAGWTYRNFYPDAHVLTSAFDRADQVVPYLPVVIDDPALFRALVTAYRAFEEGGSSLARESLMRAALTRLVLRHARRPPTLPKVGREDRALHLVREALTEGFARNVTLGELARQTGLNPFTLLRAFRRAYGLPPHAYQLQVRLRHAKRLLRDGETISGAAVRAGFADQSHLGRHFRRTFGLTPQQYQRGVNFVLSP